MSNTDHHRASIHSLLNPEPLSSIGKKHGFRIKTMTTTKTKTNEGVTSNNITKPKRKRITPDQFRTLSNFFLQTDTPNHELRDKISKLLNMTNREVQVWFQNRRAKVNRIKLQEQQKLQQEYFHQGIILYHHLSSDQQLLSSPPQSPPQHNILCDTSIDSSHMSPIDILATAAEYVQRCDQLQQQQQYQSPSSSSSSSPSLSPTSPSYSFSSSSSSSWRPWI
ncbi:uncharacterized protein BX664DRAFT_356431 [Halteromyces radiatus]|uniref:uncharacterized protein n=1 Tax=Halteromyces radiatus TaxID=101107 RepID=UPI002220E965|nr:uncharacterized protein BX664DRAFT_356431 [Halteromyces radiatus]KAI8097169.1 hypothetical protein BX664DRAFT_356431 [Halteromyces radiatus]